MPNRFLKAPPRLLYKYRPINEHTIDTITQNRIFFPQPSHFNDPFDCNIVPWPKGIDDDKIAFAYYEKLSNEFGKIRNSMRICCFSEVNNDVLMFAHYSAGHTGICMEFEVTDVDFFDLLGPVEYPFEFPTFDPTVSPDLMAMMKYEIFTKHHRWSYEREWRIVKPGAKPEKHEFPEDTLKGIIFGSLIRDTDRQKIESVLAGRKGKIQMYLAKRIKKSFDLEIEPI